jgi:hypothetical protein
MFMNCKRQLIITLVLLLAVPAFADSKKKKPDRVTIEKMEAVPCGAKEKGLTGLGSVWASIGITSVNSDEKLCPQYMLRSDDMEYHVRPLDKKHPVLLPVGQEGEIHVKKDKFDMRVVDGDHKMRHYQVVAMKPIDHSDSGNYEGSKYTPSRTDPATKSLPERSYAGTNTITPATKPDSPQ